MPVEPIDPDDLAHEQQSELVDEEHSVTDSKERSIESPEADALEQRADVEGDDE